MAEEKQLSHEDIVADILKSVPEEVAVKADFPSRGLFYELDDPSRPVEIKPLTFEDERNLASMKDTKGLKSLNYLISKCLNNMGSNQLLEMDKMYILMKIREISYGEDFKANIKCPGCGDTQPISINISKLQIKRVPEDLTNPREIDLPVCGKTASVVFPRSSDSEYFTNLDVASKNIWRFVKSIGECENRKVISDVIDKLPLRDIHALLEGISQSKYGIETKFIYRCDVAGCETETKMEVPFDETFFTMN